MPIDFFSICSTSSFFLISLRFLLGKQWRKLIGLFRLANCWQLLLNVIYTIFMLFVRLFRGSVGAF